MLKMKHFIIGIFALSLGVSLVQAAKFDFDAVHTQIGFKIRHIVSKTKGHFKKFSGEFEYDEKNPKKLKINITIETASIDTDNEKRDGHLRSKDFFNTEKFPEMTFKSTKVKEAGKNKLKVTGDLTLLGVTKPVTLDVDILGLATGPMGKVRVGISATGKLNRKDYGMTWNKTLDKGGLVVGNEVEILIEVEGIQK